MNRDSNSRRGFSLVEVVVAMGLVSFSVLVTFGLLSVANDTSKNARDEGLAAQLASNEFDRLRSLSSANFPTTYTTRYFNADLKDLGTSKVQGSIYAFSVAFATPPDGTADVLANAEVRFPAFAKTADQTVFRFTTLLNKP